MSCLTEKTIGELLDDKFFIPSYQRGYRWTKRQVEDLLNDVWDFITKPGKKENEWYCLQPIVVKKTNSHYEVLDGQQRLTTIFLILKHLERFIESERKCFEIEFETRNTELINSKEFLQEIDAKTVIESKTNIDYFHIFQAYEKIKDWFQEKANRGERSISSKFITPFLESTKVIWYEVASDKDAIEIFTRINMGKIPLTNAELIKALFLNSSNFPNSESEEIRLRQLEIASEWDRIEYSLQNEELWYFINNSENELPTRIEHIFNIMKNIEDVQNGNDQYSTFRFFSEKFKTNTKDEIDNNWKEIKRIFQTIEEWFSDRELYHKVGFLITSGEKITDLLIDAKSSQKNDFKKLLDLKISEKIKCNNLEGLEYGDGRIKNILLLHNIQTMLSNKNETSRFPFDRFKKENWDIEHIHAVATEMPKNKQHRIDWLNNSKEYINDDEKLTSSISDFVSSYDEKIKENPESFDELANSVLEYYSKKSNIETDINDLSNLVLLDSGTNRSYKNAVFPAKRKTIINKEKEGTFIPVCTKNVFLKYYTPDLEQMTFWDESDRKYYFENINTTLYQ
jgi:chaperonin cofactor prefoldin